MFEVIALAQQCSPAVDTNVALSIIKKESSFNPYAIGVNRGGKRLARQPTDYNTAVLTAEKLIREGNNIDMGYAQINSANLKRLGMSVGQVFDPCNNLKAMQYILSDCYAKAGNYDVQTRLSRAFSCYNTGNYSRGFQNGYVNSINAHLSNFVANSYSQQNQYDVKSISVMSGNELANHANSLLNENGNVGFVSVIKRENQTLSPLTASEQDVTVHDVFRASRSDIFK